VNNIKKRDWTGEGGRRRGRERTPKDGIPNAKQGQPSLGLEVRCLGYETEADHRSLVNA
jgi:hypothetical protein